MMSEDKVIYYYPEKLKEKIKKSGITLEEARYLNSEDELWKDSILEVYNLSESDLHEYKTGETIKVNRRECTVINIYPDTKLPKWVILHKNFKNQLTWYEAMDVDLPDDWIIPSEEDFKEIGEYLSLLQEKDILFEKGGNYIFWSSTEDEKFIGNAFVFNLTDKSITSMIQYTMGPLVCAFRKLENIKETN